MVMVAVSRIAGRRVAVVAIVSLFRMGRRLRLTTVAEGVEEASTLKALRQLGVDEIQGYFYSPPLPIEALWEWIEQHEARNDLRATG
jgi:EAL domain-containing protein (putative c-di-GMP-specific phosphodiesterase class I)